MFCADSTTFDEKESIENILGEISVSLLFSWATLSRNSRGIFLIKLYPMRVRLHTKMIGGLNLDFGILKKGKLLLILPSLCISRLLIRDRTFLFHS